jgi:hypothetical protein
VHDVDEGQNELPAGHSLPFFDLVARVIIKRHIRDMDPSQESGGSDAKILGDTEAKQWMVKAPNNPQGKRILANEYVAAALGARIGAPMQPGAVCLVSDELAATMKLSSGAMWSAGEAFGSALAEGTKPYLETMAPEIKNRDQLLGALAIDTWLTQHDSRQARVRDAMGRGYDVIPVDFGHCIGAGTWVDLETRPPIISLHDPNHWSSGTSGAAAASLADAISGVTDGELEVIVGSIPGSWEVNEEERARVLTFLVSRRGGLITALRVLAPGLP